MAKIQNTQKSGSVGPSTFLNSPHGLIERQRVIPLDPKTAPQRRQRGWVELVAGQWRTLTDAQRAGWWALAGQLPGPLHGCAAYQRVNVNRLAAGLPLLTEAPPPPVFGILVASALVADDRPSVRVLQLTATVAPDAFLVDATPPLSAGLSYVEKLFRRVTVVPGHAGPGVDLDLTAAYVARFCAPGAGQRIFLRLTALKDGFKDTPRQWDALVAPHAG